MYDTVLCSGKWMPHCVLLTKGRQRSLKMWFWCFVSNKCFAAYDSILTAFLLCSNFLKWVGKLQSHCNSSRITSAFNHASLRKPSLGWWCLSMAQKSCVLGSPLLSELHLVPNSSVFLLENEKSWWKPQSWLGYKK